MTTLTRCDAKMEKKIRMSTTSNLIENGQVYLPEKAPWLATYEMATFNHGKHDDQVDSTSQALNWFKTRAFEPAMLTCCRNRVLDDYRKGYIRRDAARL